jgi:hypothetical protein
MVASRLWHGYSLPRSGYLSKPRVARLCELPWVLGKSSPMVASGLWHGYFLYRGAVISQSPGLRGSASYPGYWVSRRINFFYPEGVASESIPCPNRSPKSTSTSSSQPNTATPSSTTEKSATKSTTASVANATNSNARSCASAAWPTTSISCAGSA